MLRSRDRIRMREQGRDKELSLLEQIARDLRKVEEYEAMKARGMRVARSAVLTIGGSKMPATIVVGGAGATAVFTEFTGLAGTGSVIAPISTPVFSSSDVTIATVDQSGNVAAVAPGTATISATDPGNNLTASDTVTVTAAVTPPPPVAQSATLVVTAN